MSLSVETAGHERYWNQIYHHYHHHHHLVTSYEIKSR